MISETLTFLLFLLIGLELRESLSRPKQAIAPAICALAGMVFPALIFALLVKGSHAWAIAMPTDVALAIGALSLLGKRVNPSIRLFILMLAVADDFFSLIAIGLFFRSDLNLASAIYTIGAATLGFLLPYRGKLISLLAPLSSFIIIPLYVWINLLSQLDFSHFTGNISTTLVISRVVGKVLGISIAGLILMKFTSIPFPKELKLHEIVGVGFLAGMGLTVSIVIAKITLSTKAELAQVQIGLFLAALISAVAGTAWLLIWSKAGAPRQD